MSRVVSRCVMPKTIEANRANTKAALKWVRWMIIVFPRSLFFPDGDVVGVGHRNEVQQSSDDHELGSVVGDGESDCALASVHGEGDDIHPAGTQVADESEHVEDVAAIRFVDVALHQQAEHEQGSDGNE